MKQKNYSGWNEHKVLRPFLFRYLSGQWEGSPETFLFWGGHNIAIDKQGS